MLVLLEVPLAVFYAQRERERIAADVEHDASVLATFYEDDLEGDGPLDSVPADEYRDRTGAGSSSSTATASPGSTPTRPSIATSPPVQRSSWHSPGTPPKARARPKRSKPTCSMSPSPSRREASSTGPCASPSIPATSTPGYTGSGGHSPASLQWSSSSSPSSGGGLPGQSPDRFDDSTATPHGSPAATSPSTLSRSTARPRCGHSPTRCRRWHDVSTSCCEANARSSPMPPTNCEPHSQHCASASTTCKVASPRATSTELDAAIDETTRLAALVTSLLQLARADEHPATGVADLARLTVDRVDTWTAVASPNARHSDRRHTSQQRPRRGRPRAPSNRSSTTSSTTPSTHHPSGPRSP